MAYYRLPQVAPALVPQRLRKYTFPARRFQALIESRLPSPIYSQDRQRSPFFTTQQVLVSAVQVLVRKDAAQLPDCFL